MAPWVPSPSSKQIRLAILGAALAATLVATACLLAAWEGLLQGLAPVSGSSVEPERVDVHETTTAAVADLSSSDRRLLEKQPDGSIGRRDSVQQAADGGAAWSSGRSLDRPRGRFLRPRKDDVTVLHRSTGEAGEEPQGSAGEGGNAPYLAADDGFPPLEESTLMFMHVFKCAGSTLRHMLVDWAEENGDRGAIVRVCDYDVEDEGELCLRKYRYELSDEPAQTEKIATLKVIAGHFMWGFQRHVKTPYLMITALRNPLEVYVSGEQYMHRKETNELLKAQTFVSEAMLKVMSLEGPLGLQQGQIAGFIRRFAGVRREVWFKNGLEAGEKDAIRNLETFWIVGVVEQYRGFEKVLQQSLDAVGRNHSELWNQYAETRYNTSPIETRDVLAGIDPHLVHLFNGTLALQWKVYERAVSLWDVRCRQSLPADVHEELCTVPPAPRSYQ